MKTDSISIIMYILFAKKKKNTELKLLKTKKF